MPNTTLTIDMITRETLRCFNNELKFVKSIDRQHDASFAKSGAKIGSALRIRKPAQVTVGTGATATAQDFQEDYTTLTVGTQNHALLQFTSAEMTLHLDEFSKRVIQPVAIRLANHVDQTAAATVYKNIYNFSGAAGTVPGTITTWMAGVQKLNEFSAPTANRKALITPAAEAATVVGFSGLFNNQSKVGAQYENGAMGTALGMDWFMSQNTPTHTAGTWTTATNMTCTDATETTGNAGTLKVAANAGTIAFKAGDVINVAGVYAVNPVTKQNTGSLMDFVVTTDVSVTTVASDITVQPLMIAAAVARKTVTAQPANGAVVTLKSGTQVPATSGGSYGQNLLYVPDAFTFATADLEMPAGAEGARHVLDGMSMRIVRDYNITSDTNLCRVDILWGIATQIAQNAVRVTS